MRTATLPVSPDVVVDCAGATDRGRERRENQDQFLIAELTRSLTLRSASLSPEAQQALTRRRTITALMVADGVASSPAGQRASALALETLARTLLEETPWAAPLREDPDSAQARALTDAAFACQEALDAEGRRLPARRGMGTTLTAALLEFPRAALLHVGDSRCYLLRDRRLRQLTHDHTVAQQLADEGVIALEEVEFSRYRNVLWNAVGGGTGELAPDVHTLELRLGDTLLLCTDGLTKHLGPAEMAALLDGPPEECCDALVHAANMAGGSDNIAVVVARLLPRGRPRS